MPILKALDALVLVVLAACLLIPFILYWGWAAHLCWNWVIPPLFALPPLSIWQAIALTSVISLFLGKFGRPKKKGYDNTDYWQAIANFLITPLISVGVVYAITHWIW